MPAHKYLPYENAQDGDAPEDTQLLPPYEVYLPMAVTDSKSQPRRPLPRVPNHPAPLTLSAADSASVRPLPRRRASGGTFAAGPPALVRSHSAMPTFFVCNRNEADSPISPVTPFYAKNFNPTSPRARAASGLPLLTIPATPRTPLTPGLVHVQSPSESPMSSVRSPATDPTSPATLSRLSKRHCRHAFGGSMGTIPANVLAELRSLGDGAAASPTLDHSEDDEDTDPRCYFSPDDEDEDADYEEGEVINLQSHGSNAWVVRSPGNRNTLKKWIQDLGEDRWVAERYPMLLQAL